MIISEIYAVGHQGVSAFLVVEAGVVVHYGSHKWGETIAFEGVTAPVCDRDCEVLAVICGLMMVRGDNRKSVNVYTGSTMTQIRYYRCEYDSPFMEIYKRYAEGMDIFADRWLDTFLERGHEMNNPHIQSLDRLLTAAIEN